MRGWGQRFPWSEVRLKVKRENGKLKIEIGKARHGTMERQDAVVEVLHLSLSDSFRMTA
jgi:hypothetical protein